MPLRCSQSCGYGVAAFMLPDALKPDIQCARTHWVRGFMTFQLARRPEGASRE
jgi:hypothetical protein